MTKKILLIKKHLTLWSLASLGLGFSILLGWTQHSSAQVPPGFSVAVAPDLSIVHGEAAKNFAAFSQDVALTEELSRDLFNFIHGLTANARIGPQLDCRIQSQKIQGTRKFSSGTKWVEYLNIELTTDHMGPRTLKFSFPMHSRLGRRIINMDQVGVVEEIKIETSEPYMNWFLFRHDGKQIVWAEMGNMYSFAPCLLKD